MYIIKHNSILGGMFINTKAQLHVSAIKVGHLQVVHEKFSISYTKVCGDFIGCGSGYVRDLVCFGEGGMNWGCLTAPVHSPFSETNEIPHVPTTTTYKITTHFGIAY